MPARIKDPKGINIFPAAWVEANITQAKHSNHIRASTSSRVLAARVYKQLHPTLPWFVRFKDLGSIDQEYKASF